MTDPLIALRVPDEQMRAIDPWTRARTRMEAGEAVEERQRAEAELSRREQFQDQLRVAEMRDRVELATQGFVSRDAAAYYAEVEQVRQGRIVELRDELARLTGQAGHRPVTAMDVELEQHRKGEAEWNGGSCRRMRELSLVQQDAAERGEPAPVIRRTGGVPRPLPVQVLPGMLRRAGAPAVGDF